MTMYEHVVVERIDTQGTIFVGCDAKACGNCSGSMFCNVKHKTFPAKNPDGLELRPGDVVELYLPPGKTIFSTFMTLMVPLAMFLVGYYLAGLFNAQASELTRFVFGIGGVLAGFLIAWLFFKRRRNSYIPVISSVIAPYQENMEGKNEGGAEEQGCGKQCDACPSHREDGSCDLQ